MFLLRTDSKIYNNSKWEPLFYGLYNLNCEFLRFTFYWYADFPGGTLTVDRKANTLSPSENAEHKCHVYINYKRCIPRHFPRMYASIHRAKAKHYRHSHIEYWGICGATWLIYSSMYCMEWHHCSRWFMADIMIFFNFLFKRQIKLKRERLMLIGNKT